MREPVDYAVAYAAIGWHVFPVWSCHADGTCRCLKGQGCERPGKHPHRLAPRGHLSATTDEEKIREWWAQDAEAGIGVSLGPSGLVALDIDPRNGGDATLGEIEHQHGIMTSALVAETQGGGQHRVFVAKPGMEYPSTLGPGLDLKDKGYICVEPTVGPSGKYRWLDGRSPFAGVSPSPLPPFIAALARPNAETTRHNASVPILVEDQWRQLEDALKHVDASGYETWKDVGLALRPHGERGFAVWDAWSRGCPEKYDGQEARRKWDRDFGDARGEITYRSIFKMAQDAGWQQAPDSVPTAASRWTPLPWDDLQLQPIDYLVDDFLARSLMTLAGKPGTGKTTVMVSLCAIVAGFNLPGSEMSAPVRGRKIIYITEDTEQLRRQLVALHRNFGVPIEAIKNAFCIVPAYRAQPKELQGLEPLIEQMTVHLDGGLQLRPWVIFDTTSASFNLEEENSNSEVAAVLAELKSRYYERMECSLCLVAHTSKNATRDMLFDPRGAGAWAGDTTLTAGLCEDGGARYLVLGKRRYSPLYTRVTISLSTATETVLDRYGRPQTVVLNSALLNWAEKTVVDPRVITPETLAQRADDAVIVYVVGEARAGRAYSLSGLSMPAHVEKIGCARDHVRAAVDRLVKRGLLERARGRPGTKEGWQVQPTPAGINHAEALASRGNPRGTT